MNDDWHMLAEEERLFCDVLTRICAEQIAPKAAHTDEAAAFVHDQLAVLGQAGMLLFFLLGADVFIHYRLRLRRRGA